MQVGFVEGIELVGKRVGSPVTGFVVGSEEGGTLGEKEGSGRGTGRKDGGGVQLQLKQPLNLQL